MSTVTEYAGAASGTSWTNATNANADDGAYATYTIAVKNTTGNVNTLSNFGFDSSIPSGSTINSVTLEVEHKVSGTGGIAHLESAVAISGTPGTFNTDSAEPTVDTARSYNSARPGGGSWTRNDLLDGTFTVQLRARSGNNATSIVYSWDYARVVVDYTAPVTHATSGVLTGPGSTVTGSAARTRVHATSGVLTGPGAVVDGSAARSGEPVEHATSGALAGPGAVIAGSAARTRVHASAGVLVGPGAVIEGSASRTRVHATTGELVGAGAVMTGTAEGPGSPEASGEGWYVMARRRGRR